METEPVYPIISRLISPELRLAQYRPNQAEALFAGVEKNRSVLRKYLYWVDRQRNIAHTRDFIMDITRLQRENGALTAGIWMGPTLIGTISLHPINWKSRTASIGFWVDAEFTRKGIATKAVAAVRDFSFKTLGLNRLEIITTPDNRAVEAIALKTGFQPASSQSDMRWPHDPMARQMVFGLNSVDVAKAKKRS